MIAVITELQIKSIFNFPKFVRHSAASVKQSIQSPGNIKTDARGGWMKGLTITVWESEADMKQFRNNGSHKEAMKIIRDVSSGYKTIVYETDSIPTWKEARAKLQEAPLVRLK